MSTGSMSTQNLLQQLYAMQLMGSMQPYMGQTTSTIAGLGQSATNTWEGIPDFNKYVKQTYTDPMQYSLDNQLKDLAHTNEYFSSGHQAKRADAMNSMNTKLNQLVGQEMMSQREGQMSGMESALQRQLKALQQFNNIMTGPLSIQGQENTVTQKSLLGI